MKKIIFITAAYLIAIYGFACGTIINIPLDYPTIQTGIDASSDGDTVLVQPGIYVENINFNGHNIVLGSLFLTTGDTSHISTTIIDGDSAGSVVTLSYGNDTTTVVIGFTIQNGSGSCGGGIVFSRGTIRNNIIEGNYAATYGGGIHCEGPSGAIICYNVISNNFTSGSGGGICFYSSGGGTVKGNIIVGNSSSYNGGGINHISGGLVDVIGNQIIGNNTGGVGGGIYSGDASTTITSNTISGNYSIGNGGGIYCIGADVIRYNTISGNSSNGTGGGICLSSGLPAIENNSIIQNISGNGGGVAAYASSAPIIRNNLLCNNTASNAGGGFYCSSTNSPISVNTIFWANSANIGNEIYINSGTPEFTYCDIKDTIWAGEGNISVDPLFRDTLNGDFHLMSTGCGDPFDSPCIDAGSIYSLDTLLDCSWGLGTIASDIGAYGGGDSTTGNNVVINVPGDYPTIQLAIDSCNDGDTVLVQPDTYYENINFDGRNIVVGSMFIMSGDISYISSTIIDGSDSASVVTFDSGEDGTARIIGFTIQNGWDNHGGGIYCSDSDPAISNNIISENSVNSFGGGILFLNSSSIFSNNLVVDNSANQGGGICCMGSNPTIINNVVTGNVGNLSGGGIYSTINSAPIMANSIFWGDSASFGFEIDHDNTSVPEINYCDVQGGWTGIGNIDIDPFFRDPSNRDFHLTSLTCGDSVDSPCIDIGHPDLADTLLDCSWGLGGSRSDMGAYGGGELPISGIPNEYLPVPCTFLLNQNYPNPFNASTTIRFILPESQYVQLTIYDLLGRQVRTLIDEHKPPGSYTVSFNASGLSSGVYFYRLQAGEMVETKRMVLLK
jgi:parallel beta-helix repeat protein